MISYTMIGTSIDYSDMQLEQLTIRTIIHCDCYSFVDIMLYNIYKRIRIYNLYIMLPFIDLHHIFMHAFSILSLQAQPFLPGQKVPVLSGFFHPVSKNKCSHSLYLYLR